MNKHIADGITYSRPKIYKCKICGKRLTPEEFRETECESKQDE